MNTSLGFSHKAVHPGELLKEELRERGIAQKLFAEMIEIPYTRLNDILNARRPVSVEFALLVEAATGINAEMLVNMQTRHTLQMARKNKQMIQRMDLLANRVCDNKEKYK